MTLSQVQTVLEAVLQCTIKGDCHSCPFDFLSTSDKDGIDTIKFLRQSCTATMIASETIFEYLQNKELTNGK